MKRVVSHLSDERGRSTRGYLPDGDADLDAVHTDGCDRAVGHAGPRAAAGGKLHVAELTELIHGE